MIETISAVLSGTAVGFILGMLGGGGSILATPLLLYVVGMPPHTAIGTGAFAVSASAYINLVTHAKKGHVRWRCALPFSVVGVLGAFVGSTIGKKVDSTALLFLFGLMMFAIGLLMLRPTRLRKPQLAAGSDNLPAIVGLAFLAGLASGFFGIGGGFLVVPGMIYATGMPMINAVGSSLLAVGSFGVATAINYSLSGLVDWSVGLKFVAGGIVGGTLGMALATHLASNKDTLKRCFAYLIFAVALYVLYRSGLDLL